MVDRPYLTLSIKACGMAAQERLPLLAAGRGDERVTLDYCTLARRVGVGLYLSSGVPDEMFEYLRKSGGAWLDHTSRRDAQDRVSGRFEPVLDAIAGGSMETVRSLRDLRTPYLPDLEYEEDHLYTKLLQELATGTGMNEQVEADLARYEELDDEDPRGAACRALFEGDSSALEGAVAALDADARERLEEQIAKAQVDPDHRTTTGKISVELIAWARLAEGRGMAWPVRSPLCPPTARAFGLTGAPDPDSWQHFPIGGDLA